MSNDSEHLPEEVPDWAGLRMFDTSGKDDYTALIEGLRKPPFRHPRGGSNIFSKAADAVESLLAMEQRLTDHIVQLAAERDALQIENERLRDDWASEVLPVAIERDEARAERDALREQLNAMQVEWRLNSVEVGPKGKIRLRVVPVTEQRLVSEWTVVEGEQSND